VLGLAAGALAIVVAISWLIGSGYWGQKPSQDVPPPPAGTFRPTAEQLKTLTVEPVALREFFAEERTEGKIAVNGDRATPVYSPYSGRVTRVLGNLGDVVKQGQPLATIDASEFAQGQNDLHAATAQVTLARANEARKHALNEIKGGSLADWQQAQAELATAETSLHLARNRLRILGLSDAAITALEKSEQIDPSTEITSPIQGVVVDRQIGPGQYAQAGASTPIFTIADLSSVWLLASVRESDAEHVRRGQKVEVTVLAYPDRVFKAEVVAVSPVMDPNTHRLAVRAVVDNKDGALKPDMFASFRIVTSAGRQAPAVPDTAVVYEGDAAHVWVVQSADVISIRAIHVGRKVDGFVEVLDGLKTGERVITKGSIFIDRAAAG
jgi:cobalt-zinc-cadmium efflux system membrane fusion protein